MYSMQRSCSSQQFMSSNSTNQSSSSTFTSNGGNGGNGGGGGDPLQRSSSISNCTIVNKRGFKPSDRFDPAKKEFLLGLSKQIWQRDNPIPGHKKSIDLQKILTPADDAPVILPQKNRKLYASSAFFAPGFHPTVEDQVELARMISSSLYDSSNVQSKGQSMYVNRKKRSVKWVHEGNEGSAIEYEDGDGDIELASPDDSAKPRSPKPHQEATQQPNSKLPLKLVMDPRGVTKDFESSQKKTDIQTTQVMTSEKCNELMSALLDTGDKGAEIFAKRRKCSEEAQNNNGVAVSSGNGHISTSQVVSSSSVSQSCVKSQEVVNINRMSSSSVESNSTTQNACNQSVESVGCQPIVMAAPAPLPNYLLQTLPAIVKRPKGWKPVCPNLPKLNLPVGSYVSQGIQSTVNTFSSVQSSTTESQQETSESSANEEPVLKVFDEHPQHLQQTFVNCLAKSPELIKSDAREHFVDYDSTVNELKSSIQQCDPQLGPPSPMIVAASSVSRQSPLTLAPATQRVTPKPVVQPVFSARASTPIPVNAQPEEVGSTEEPESYKTIPVRDLISTFEKQSQPALRYNIREDMFPVQSPQKSPTASAIIEPKTSPEQSITPPTQPQPTARIAPEQPLIKPVDSPPATKTELPTTSEPAVPQPDEQFTTESNITSTTTDDAFFQEINTFNEVAAEFGASIISTSADSKVSNQPELTFDDLVSPSPTAYFRPPPNIQSTVPPTPPAAPPAPNHFNQPFTVPLAPSMPYSPQPPVAQYQPPPQPQWQPNYRPPSQQFTYSPIVPESPSSVAARRSPLDMAQLKNYNRAASGWGQSKDFYRPVTFNKPKVVLAYSDF